MECDNYDVCIMCFASGEETNAHKRSHSYRVLVRYMDIRYDQIKMLQWCASPD